MRSALSNAGRSGQRALLFLCFVLAGEAGAQTSYPLPFRPLDAEYSVALNRMVMISSSPPQVQIYDPATRANVSVNLPAAPLDLALSPNGLFAAVAHDGLVSYINLAGGRMERSYPVAGRIPGIVVGEKYLYLEVIEEQIPQLRLLDLGSGTVPVTLSASYSLCGARLDASGGSIYYAKGSFQLGRLILQNGLPFTGSLRTGGVQPLLCGGIWIAADGERLFNGCGSVVELSNLWPRDLAYRGAFPDRKRVKSLWEFRGRDELAVIPEVERLADPNADMEVRLYKKETLRPAGRFALDRVVANGVSHPVRGRWVFASGGSQLYVITQTEASAGLTQDFSLRVFDLSATAPCAPDLSATTVTAPGEGGVVKVNVTGGASCLYRSDPTAAWLQMASEALRYGPGETQILVRPNPGAARTATVTIGGRVVTVNQAAKPATLPNPLQLGYPLQGAAYSRSQDRLLLLTPEPPELHILNVFTNEERLVPLRQRGISVAVDPTGNTAAVGHEGLVSLVDLVSGVVTREYPVLTDPTEILWGNNGYLYLSGFQSRQPVLNLRLSDAWWSPSQAASCAARKQPGAEVVTVCGVPWSTARGELAPDPFRFQGFPGGFWFFEDGNQLVDDGGKVLRATWDPADDWVLSGTLGPGAELYWAEHSLPGRMLAAVGRFGAASTPDEVRLYSDDGLNMTGRRALAGGVQGKYVFWNQDGTALFALGKAANGAAEVTVVSPAANPAGCTASFAGATATLGTGASTNTAAVTTGGSCAWSANSSAPWLRILSGSFGIGPVTLSYAVEPNRQAVARTATIALSGGATLTVTQSAAPVAVEARWVSIAAAGETRSFAVTTALPGTAWTATATVPWVTFPSGTTGVGNGTVLYTVAPNAGAIRTGLVRVNTADFLVSQAAGSNAVTVNRAPSFVSASSAWTGQHAFVFSDPDGAADLGVVNVLINRALDGRAACYIAFNAATEQFYLVDDAGTGLLELAASPASAAVENSQCRIERNSVTVTRSFDRLTLVFTPMFYGYFFSSRLAVYAAARDRAEANSKWQSANVIRGGGTQAVLGALSADLPPLRVATGATTDLQVQYTTTDTSNAGALTTMQVLINSAVDANGACYIGIDRAGMRAYLVTDDGKDLLPGGVALGEQTGPRGTTENSRCVLSGEGSSLTSTPGSPQVSLTLRLQFKSGLMGNRFIYTGAQAAGVGRNSGWELLRALRVE
ncbi:MAG: BACON domain-containing protein [Acidobacteriaceae bacterium]|nr:BACON domain-containing protein [Acidobacteriaceae bacterium]